MNNVVTGEQGFEIYDSALPHKPHGECACAGRYTRAVRPIRDYTHFMINPFSGSDALCGSVHNGECVSLGPEDTTCPRCLSMLKDPATAARYEPPCCNRPALQCDCTSKSGLQYREIERQLGA